MQQQKIWHNSNVTSLNFVLIKYFFLNYVHALIYKISKKFIFISAIILIMKLLRGKSAFVLIGQILHHDRIINLGEVE